MSEDESKFCWNLRDIFFFANSKISPNIFWVKRASTEESLHMQFSTVLMHLVGDCVKKRVSLNACPHIFFLKKMQLSSQMFLAFKLFWQKSGFSSALQTLANILAHWFSSVTAVWVNLESYSQVKLWPFSGTYCKSLCWPLSRITNSIIHCRNSEHVCTGTEFQRHPVCMMSGFSYTIEACYGGNMLEATR